MARSDPVRRFFVGVRLVFLCGRKAVRIYYGTEHGRKRTEAKFEPLNQLTDVQWEVFGTPEWSGGVPGPTDFVSLIAVGSQEPGSTPGGFGEDFHSYFVPNAE